MERRDRAIELMTRFAERTGLTSNSPPRRYLWTDGFAVCNFLGLADATGDSKYAELALRLIDQVCKSASKFDPHRRGSLTPANGAKVQCPG